MSKTTLMGILGLILTAGQIASLSFLPEGPWQLKHVYWLTPSLLVLSVLLILVVRAQRKKDHQKTGITFGFMSIAKLLGVAVIALVMSKQLLDDEKLAFSVHFLAPALIFIVLELIVVRGYI